MQSASLDASKILQLQLTANTIRQEIIKMVSTAKSGHPGGALGLADIFALLYFHILQHRPADPTWAERDYLLLSNGHTCPVLYATLAEAGYFDKTELAHFREINSKLQGHPHRGSVPGIETSSGPLGLGLSQAAGLASALKLDQKPNQVYVVLSDGEQQEGQTWEAYLYAGANHLGNITAIIDANNMQITGRVEQIMPLEPLAAKLTAFRWQVLEVDGHDLVALNQAFNKARETTSQPTALICRTIPGKGVSFMENDYRWHGQPPTPDQTQQALTQLERYRQQLLQKGKI